MTSAQITTTVKGHVCIRDSETGEVLLDKDNAVHNQNMAIAIARGLSNEPQSGGVGTYQIYKLELGNGGTSINSMSQITFQTPNVTGLTAGLYNQTYSEVVDESISGTPSGNSVTYLASSTDTTSTVITSMTIAAGEPSGQFTTDSPPSPTPNSTYAFDELGLFTSDNKLLTHIIFSPILKTSNRSLVITYTLTISVS